MKIELLAFLLFAAATPLRAEAQISLTQVDGRFQCPTIANVQECAIVWEHQFITDHPSIVRREGDALGLKLLSGRWAPVPGECAACWNVVDLQDGERFFVLREQLDEGDTWHMLDRTDGSLTAVLGYPLFSPSGHWFAATSEDLAAGWNHNILDIYEVAKSGVRLSYRGQELHALRLGDWAPRHVCWLDDATLAFSRATHTNDFKISETPQSLALRNGAWRIGPADARKCNPPVS